MEKKYIVKRAKFDGYSQAFAEIGTRKDVDAWLNDGSLEDEDVVGVFVPEFKVTASEEMLLNKLT